MRRSPCWTVIVAMFAACLFYLHCVACSAADFRYDPTLCKADARGKFFIALDHNVLAVDPPNSGAVIGNLDPRMHARLLVPPDPSEQQGCPNNPMQLLNYTYFLFGIPSAIRGQFWDAERLKLITADPDVSTAPAWELSVEKRAKSTCARAALRERTANGMDACRIKPKQDAPIEDWAADYVAPPDLYTTPTGRPFVVECDPAIHRSTVAWCNVAYVLRSGLAITYAFQPYHSPGPIPIEGVVTFDRALRKAIEGMLVEAYPWPKQNP